MLACLGYSRSNRVWLVLLLGWVLQAGMLSEEPRSICRALGNPEPQFSEARREGNSFRVITLNCAGGSMQAASEVITHSPDIVLLEESPSRKDVEELGRRMFGKGAGTLYGVDASIIARGEIKPVELDKASQIFFVAARVRLADGPELYVVGTRLVPPVLRLDLWSPGCWRDEKENRQERKEQARQISQVLRRLPKNVPVVLGGDLNAPAGDGALAPLRPSLRDTFPEGGRGWGNTVLNDFPVQRIDQIWAGRHLKALSITACKTQNSDHRMVIADLVLAR
jgi:hypothetical protein